MKSKDKIRAADMRFLNDVFDMGGGYVLDFTNRSFSEFFDDELGIDIDNPRYEVDGTSKGKRLRYFLRISDNATVVRTLLALWDYRETTRRRAGNEETIANAESEFNGIVERISGKRREEDNTADNVPITKVPPKEQALSLCAKLIEVSKLDPQKRGYAFEAFLKELFDANGLGARASFRVTGEQIDGSFILDGQTYLLEAKWTVAKVDASSLRSFNAKVEEKAKWSRGLFVSHSGFTEEGLSAFGPGKSLVCMDGLDLYEILNNRLPLSEILSQKIRRAAETGNPFVQVRDLGVV